MELVGLVMLAGVVFAGASVYSWYQSEAQSTKRALRHAQTYSIAAFPDSQQGKVTGTLQFLDRHLTAPLSGRACAYYRIRVQQYESYGNSGRWVDIINEEDGVDFVLDDGTGQAIVLVAAATTHLTEDHESRSGTFDDPTPSEQQYLDAHGKTSRSWLVNKSIRYFEGVLEPGETVSVFAYGSKEPDPRAAPAGYRDMQPLRLRMGGSANHPPLISDVPSVH